MTKSRYTALAVFVAMTAALVLSLFVMPPAYAEETLLRSGTKNITGTYIISKDCVLPKGATLYVKNGGKLYVREGADLILNGTLKIASGGYVFVKGNVISNAGSKISATGGLKIQQAGTLSLGGTLSVNKGGKVYGLGTLEVLKKFSDISCKGTVTAKIKAPEPVTENGVTTIGGVLIVNRQFSLPEDYGSGLDADTYSAFLKMKKASGYNMEIVSGFRSYEKQKQTFAYWASIDGWEQADRYSAQPGHSEHQSGLAIDITSLAQSYGNTTEGKWLAANCWKYGFILRYPKGGEDITGYIYEPWHVRYLGTSTAKLVYDSGLTLEEFLGV
ncbi:MAG: D-alanyl-D-alanine carboxypeptidase family protein, partial [Oscillospiraceae bacterium]